MATGKTTCDTSTTKNSDDVSDSAASSASAVSRGQSNMQYAPAGPTVVTTPLANPTIDWNAKDLPNEYRNFEEMCDLMFNGPFMNLQDTNKFSYIMLWAGTKALELWRNSSQNNKTCTNLLAVLKAHCIPSNRTFWSHRMEMRFMQQHAGETIKDFASRVTSIAGLCEWKDAEEQIVSTVIFGCSHKDAQRTILGKSKDLSLNDCIEHIARYEATDKHMKDLSVMKKGSTATPVSVNNVQRKCYNCGKQHPRGKCPAFGHTCTSCGKRNHYESVCLSETKTDDVRRQSNRGKPKYQKKSDNYHRQKKVNAVKTAIEEAPEADEYFCYAIHSEKKSKDIADVNIYFKGTSTPFKVLCKIDTGADLTVMPARVYKTICPETVKKGYITGLKPTSIRLTAYNGSNITCIGETKLQAYHAGVKKNMTVLITTERETSTIISKNDASDLKCIKFLCEKDCEQCLSPASINSVNADGKAKWAQALPLGKTTGDPKQDILELFPSVFDGIGQFQDTYKIELTADYTPVRHAPRRVPEALKPAIKAELESLVEQDIIKPVTEATDWVNSLVYVTKEKSGELRLCLDPKDLNKCIKRPHYYTPTIDDILPDLHGAKYISTLDAKSGYWNIPLDPESQLLTTFNTPGFGRFCFKRLPFGLISSQDIFQQRIDLALTGLHNVKPIADDIKVHGSNEIEHDISLLEACQRCLDTGLKLNPNKCHIKQKSVTFFGNNVTTDGLQPDPSKVKAIQQLAAPRDKQETRSLIGLVTYLQRYIPNTSKLLEPIRNLLKDNVEFQWDANLDRTLEEIKTAVGSVSTLAYFNHTATVTELQCDASKKGLGACLIQDGRPVSFASKSLTKAESNYSNIEREALGVVFALTRFHQYTYGRHITVITDHKPLEAIFRKALADAPPRLQRMMLRVQPYDFTITYRPGKDIPIPDCLSRLVPNDRDDPQVSGMEVKIHTVINASGSKLQQLIDETASDTTLLQLRDIVQHGWPEDRTQCPANVLPFWPYRAEIGYYNGTLVKGSRAIIPDSLRDAVLTDIHRGHMGIEKCRLRARQSVYWPNINADITQMVNTCAICQTHAGPQPNSYSLSIQDDSHYPMQRIGTDLFQWKGNDYLIVIDYYSSFPWVKQLKKATSYEVIGYLKSIFSEYGLPMHVHSDSGSQYTSEEFAQFAASYMFCHTTSSPYYHQSNGKAERYVGIVKQLLTKALEGGEDPEIVMLTYRATPLSTSKRSPGEIMFGRKLRDTLISLPIQQEDVDDTLTSSKQPTEYSYQSLSKDDPVLILDTKTGLWEKGRVVEKQQQPHQYIVSNANGRIAQRNRVHLKYDQTQAEPPSYEIQLDENEATSSTTTTQAEPESYEIQLDENEATSSTATTAPIVPDNERDDDPANTQQQRPSRARKRPSRFKDFV